MLRLKKLDLYGFKSFADREELHFSGVGIASIVGPNGCGKSNISDAVSWVLGEQSAKSLRGSRMADVIFNGSRDRKPSGMALVSLTLLDPDAYLEEALHPGGRHAGGSHGLNGTNGGGEKPKRASEIVVTRKLLRSGESEYLLNGKTCRLRDIQTLFMGTGLGPNHYAIIEQGRIGQLLTTRPLDRRGFIEEAAGVTKFKNRKRLAELKLESARHNLNRVNDILQEVSRQVGSLKRQAARARKYEQYRAELREALSRLLADRYRLLDARIREQGERSERAAGQLARLAETLRGLDEEFAAKRAQEHEWEAALSEGREQLSALKVETERLRARIEQQAKLAEENRARKEQAEAEIEALQKRLQELGQEEDSERQAADKVAGEVERVREMLRAKSDEIEREQNALREREGEQERSRQQVLQLMGEISRLRNQMAQIDEYLAGNQRQCDRSQEDARAAEAELAELEAAAEKITSGLEDLQQRLEQLTTRREELRQAIAGRKEQVQRARAQAERAGGELSRLKARRDSLDEILSHHAYTTETVKNLFRLLEQAPRRDFEPIGILADYVEVDAEFERATEDFLREELEFVVVRNWGEAQQGLELLRSELQGFATFLVHPEHPVSAEEPALGPETGVVGRLADHIRLTNGLAASASTLLPRLRSCYLVEDQQAARRLALQYPDLYFLLSSGVCYRGYTISGGRKSAAGPLTLKRELRELGPRIQRTEEARTTASREAAEGESEIERSNAELEGVRAEAQEVEKALLAAEHEMRQINDHRQRAGRRQEAAQRELDRLGEEASRARAERELCQQALAAREKEQGEAEEALAELRQGIEAAQRRLAGLAEEQTGCRTQLATLEERRKAALTALARVEQMIQEQRQRLERVTQQIERWGAERERLLADNVELEAGVEQGLARREELEAQVREWIENLENSRARTAEIERETREVRAEHEKVREERSQCELALVQLRSDKSHLNETCRNDLDQSLDDLLEAYPEALPEEELRQLEERHQQLRGKMDNLGPVNVLALEEYKEAQQREEFLMTQRQDLLDSVHDTQKAIKEIDAASRKRFQEAFEAINNHFREVFATLFGGGTAEMRLTDPENPDESGVDIVASPPGKKLQNVALLSGGEKSLTALGLLMATFRYRPSPFCVLDEVDAALDEANILRFRRLIQSMSDQTQIILITHAKSTMEAAQTLYGVTMPNPGVSKIVSVKMADHRPRPGGGREGSKEVETVRVPA